MKFKDFKSHLISLQEQSVKKWKTGKGNKFQAEIKKEKGRFAAYIDGEKLDTYKTQKDAELGVEDFISLTESIEE